MRLHPTDAQALTMKAECQINLSDVNAAKVTMKELERYVPVKDMCFLQACIASQDHDWKRAKILIDKVWTHVEPESLPDVAWLKVGICKGLGDTKGAVEALQFTEGQKSFTYLLTKGRSGSVKDATLALEKLCRVGWNEEALWLLSGFSPEQLPDEIVKLWAQIAQNAHRYDLAVHLLNDLLKKDRVFEREHGLEATSNLIYMQAYSDALRELDRLQPTCASQAQFWVQRMLALKALGRTTQAEQAAEKGLRMAPNNAELYYQRSDVKFAFNRKAEAMADLAKAIELDPTRREYLETRILHEIGHPEELHVASDFDKLIDLAKPSDRGPYWIRKASYLAMRGDLESAVKTLELCLGNSPSDKKALVLMRTYCAELKRNKIRCAECEARGL